MTPKEKAKELINKYIHHTLVWNELNGWVYDFYSAKNCALIAVDEILIIMNEEYFSESEKIKYWQQVKQKIEKL
jgi:hypothetical protein